MKNKTLLIVIAVIIVLAIAVFAVMYFGKQKAVAPTNPSNGTLDDNMSALSKNFLACTQYSLTSPSSDNTQSFTVSILGIENSKCHYKLDVGGHGLDCLFPTSALSGKLLNQVFGNEEGLSSVVSDNCQSY